MNMESWIFKKLSTNWCGNDSAPLTNVSMKFKSHHGSVEVVSFIDDAGEIGLGYMSQWHHIYHRKDFHRIVMWYLRHWIFSDWFGARRAIWFWLLHRKVARYSKHAPTS